jgi:hypothetical protein
MGWLVIRPGRTVWMTQDGKDYRHREGQKTEEMPK